MQDRGSFRNLKVWHASMDLIEDVFRVTARFPVEERYGLAAQLRRACVSIASNIARGSVAGLAALGGTTSILRSVHKGRRRSNSRLHAEWACLVNPTPTIAGVDGGGRPNAERVDRRASA
jgi:hypothetical protein